MAEPKLDIPFSEKLKNIPGVFGMHLNEMPKYKTLKVDGDFELREYQPLLVAQTTVEGAGEPAKEDAFFKLAGYIFGKNHDEKQMAMTSPVLQSQGHDMDLNRTLIEETDHKTHGKSLTMCFVLPSEVTAQTAPIPNEASVHIKKIPAQTWAVIRYSGENTQEQIEAKTLELKNWLANNNQKVDPRLTRVAQYDSPATIKFLRRNEVQIRLWTGDISGQ